MFPKIAGFDMYYIMVNLGTAVGILFYGWSYYHRIPSKKLFFQNFLIFLVLLMAGTKGAQAVRMLNKPKGKSFIRRLGEVFIEPTGSHFIGRVLVTVILYIPVYLLWKKYAGRAWKQCDLIKEHNYDKLEYTERMMLAQRLGFCFDCRSTFYMDYDDLDEYGEPKKKPIKPMMYTDIATDHEYSSANTAHKKCEKALAKLKEAIKDLI